jgi:AraC-like DNA-binding protein
MQKVKNTIPVYDICSLNGTGSMHEEVIVERFASYLKKHPNLYRAHGHSFYHLVIFTKGSGFHTIDFERFPVTAGAAYFMVPGQVHSWAFEGDTDGYVINFSASFFQAFLAESNYLDHFPFWSGNAAGGVLELPKELRAGCSAILEQLVTETETIQLLNRDMVRVQLISLFITIARATGHLPVPAHEVRPSLLLLHQFRKLVDEYYTRFKLPKEYAALLYITPNHLNALCNDLLGKPAGEVIRERVLLEAKRLLVNVEAGIAAIGYQLGFPDNSYFTKFFKKYTGITPEEFRKGLNRT